MTLKKLFPALSLLVLAGPGHAQEDPLTRPVALEYAGAFGDPGAPHLLHGSTWALGSPTLSVTMIDTGAGLVLIDAGLAQWEPVIERHLAQIGHDIRDVKLILSTEPHYDHASGIAALARDSGARVLSSEAGAKVLRAGRSDRSDPQRNELFNYPPVPVVTAVQDGEVIRLGAFEFTAHATPGHTPGSLTWSWQSCSRGDGCRTMVAAASLTSRTDGVYRYSDPVNGEALAAFRTSFETLREMPCDEVIAAHPAHAKAAGAKGEAPCRKLADFFEAELDKALEKEGAG